MEENNMNVTEVENDAVEMQQEAPVENTEKFTTGEKLAGVGIGVCVGYTLYKGGRWAFGKIKDGIGAIKKKVADKKAAKEAEVPVEEPTNNEDKTE